MHHRASLPALGLGALGLWAWVCAAGPAARPASAQTPPLPLLAVSAEASEPASPPVAERPPPGRRLDGPHDPWSDPPEEGAACRAALTAAGVQFRALPDRARPDAHGCGIPHPVWVTQGPTGIRYAGPLLIDCSLARELPEIERVLQEEARERLGEPLTRITTLGSYSCRNKRGAARPGLSEHALGNAMDVAAFHGKRASVSVALHYDPEGKRAPSKQGLFLRAVQRRLRHETRITRVLGPDWNAEHRDHFHLDRGLPWWWAQR